MSNFRLQQEGITSVTSIPNCFIEKFMPKAAGEFVKIYIYLLKCVEENTSELSISKIADAFDNTEKDVIRALKYWQKKGLLRLDFDENNVLTSLKVLSASELEDGTHEDLTVNVSAIGKPAETSSMSQETASVKPQTADAQTANVQTATSQTANVQTADSQTADVQRTNALTTDAETTNLQTANMQEANVDITEAAAPSDIKAPLPEKKSFSREQIEALSSRDEVTQLFYIIQRYMGRALTGTDINTILFFYETLGFPADVIEYLFEYCVSKGHKNMRYIEKTAIGWAESGITNLKAAKTMNCIYSDDCFKVLKAFGLSGRLPAKSEVDYVTKWTLSYGFDMDIILDACSRTIGAIHQPSFEYTDSILKKWKSQNVKTKADIHELDLIHDKTVIKNPMTSKNSNKTKNQSDSQEGSSTRFFNFDQRDYDYSELEEQLFNRKY